MNKIKTFFIAALSSITINLTLCQEPEAISYGASYISDWGRNFSGGINKGNFYMGMIDLSMSIDLEQLKLWKGGEFYIQVENTHGATPTANLVGDIHTFSNIENRNATYLYMLWYKQSIGKLTATVGVHDLNSEFLATDYAGTFINSSFGIQPSASFNLPVSIFPKPVLGAILHYKFNETLCISTAIYDGEPVSDESDIYNLDLTINREEGLLNVTEFHYSYSAIANHPGIFKLGFLYHTGEFSHLSEVSPTTKKGNQSIYAIMDQKFTKSFGAFVQLGFADENYNINPFYLGAGLNFTPSAIGREDDVLGLAMAYAKISKQSVEFDMDHETAIELTYNLKLNDNIALQPDLQYIINTGANSAIDNAFVGFIRFKIEY